MTDEPEPGVIGSLPRTRPHRRSTKRAAPAGSPPASSQGSEPHIVNTADTAGAPAAPPRTAPKQPVAVAKPTVGTSTDPLPVPPPSPGALETVVQAAAELAEIGLHAGARALRHAVSRLPRP